MQTDDRLIPDDQVDRFLTFLDEHPGAVLVGSPAIAETGVSVGLPVQANPMVLDGSLYAIDMDKLARNSRPIQPSELPPWSIEERLWGWRQPSSFVGKVTAE